MSSLLTAKPVLFGVAALAGILTGLYLGNRSPPRVTVAHIGNSFQFVNDLPRVLEHMAKGRITHQDSLLHGSLSYITFLKKGNGMVHRWNTTNAWNETYGVHDLGACTVSQLLLGYDEYLFEKDHYINDGKNPCFENDMTNSDGDPYDNSDAYFQHTLDTKTQGTWDYVIWNDQSVRPAIAYKEEKSAAILQTNYSQLLLECGATPIFIATWGYWRLDVNLTDEAGILDVPDFTAKLHLGYQDYANVLQEALPSSQKPRVAPVGLAFLTVWEENPKQWDQLFGRDYYHPSPSGTYLLACVVYSTVFGRLPDPPSKDPSDIFEESRSLHLNDGGDPLPFPTQDEAVYLRWVAKRVVFQNHRPESFELALQRLDADNGGDEEDAQ